MYPAGTLTEPPAHDFAGTRRSSRTSSTLGEKESHEIEKAQKMRSRHGSRTADPIDVVNLPYRTLTADAPMGEYLTEAPTGLQQVITNKTGKGERWELVTFTPGDPENPKNWSKLYKWWCTMVVAITCFAVAFNSGIVTAGIEGPMATFHVSEEVSFTDHHALRYRLRGWSHGICTSQRDHGKEDYLC